MSQYPECEKLLAVKDESQKLGEFLVWLSKNNYAIFEGDELNEWSPIWLDLETLLAKYYGIDLAIVEKERCAMLDAVREANKN